MQKTTRRTISFLLAALMLLSLFPASAMAMPDVSTYEAETATMPEETPGALMAHLLAGGIMSLHSAEADEAYLEAGTITIEVDEYGVPTVTMPPDVGANYALSIAESGNITIIFPPETDEGDIELALPSDEWAYTIERKDAEAFADTYESTYDELVFVTIIAPVMTAEAYAGSGIDMMPRAFWFWGSIMLRSNGGQWNEMPWGWYSWDEIPPPFPEIRWDVVSTGSTDLVHWQNIPEFPLPTRAGFAFYSWAPARPTWGQYESGHRTFTAQWGHSVTLNAGTGAHWGTTPPWGWTRSAPASGNITQITRVFPTGTHWANIAFPTPTTAPAGLVFSSWNPGRPGGNITANFTSTATWGVPQTTITLNAGAGANWGTDAPSGWQRGAPASGNITQLTRTVPATTQWSTISFPTPNNPPANEAFIAWTTPRPASGTVGTTNFNSTATWTVTPPPVVSFNLNNATTPASIPNQTVPLNGTATEPAPPPTRDGYTFRGWYIAPEERLIITEHVYGLGTQYNTTAAYARLGASNLRGVLNTWGANNLAPELRAAALTPDGVNNDVRSAPSPHIIISWTPLGNMPWAQENQPAGRTTAGLPASGAAADSALFVLSISEANHYFDSPAGHAINSDREAYGAGLNETRGWWLRSPGGSVMFSDDGGTTGAVGSGNSTAVDFRGRILHRDGSNAGTGSSTILGFRPTLWTHGAVGFDAIVVGDRFTDTNDIEWRVLYGDMERFDFTTPITRDTTLVAMWDEAVTVNFDLNGATTPASIPNQTFAPGETATRPVSDPTRDGYIFRGWYAAAERLIITERAHGGWGPGTSITGMGVNPSNTPYFTTNHFRPWADSTLRTTMTDWGAANLAPEIRASALAPNNVHTDRWIPPGAPGFTGNWDNPAWLQTGPAGFTYAGVPTPGAAANSSLFPLSMSEARQYFHAPGQFTNADLLAFDHNFPTTARPWWLRSPGGGSRPGGEYIHDNSNRPMTGVNWAGTLVNVIGHHPDLGLRPALWTRGAGGGTPIGGTFTDTNDIMWRVLAGDLVPFDFTTPIYDDTTLIAMWDAAHTVTFDPNGGTPTPPTQSVRDGETATEPTPPPTRDGYTFRGWYTGRDEIWWRVLAEDAGRQLIITRDAHGNWTDYSNVTNTPYNLTNQEHTPFTQSHLHTIMQDWGAMHLAPELRARALAPNGVDNDVRNARGGTWTSLHGQHPQPNVPGQYENQPVGRTTPGAATPGNAANASLFVLSISEVHEYFDFTFVPLGPTTGYYSDRIAYCHNTGLRRRSTWLRSPGPLAQPMASWNSGGDVGQITSNNINSGFRPALWVENLGGGLSVGDTFSTVPVRFDFTTPVHDDITLVAMWDKVETHDVTFDLNGGDPPAPATQSVRDGETATEPTPPPTREGYTFRGWYTAEPTETFTDNGIAWRVMYDSGDGYRLLLTEHVHMANIPNGGYNLGGGGYTRLAQSNARTLLNTWWTDYVAGTGVAAAAVPVNNAENDVRATLGPANATWSFENVAASGWTTPGSGAVAANGSNALFIFSVSEVNRFWPPTNNVESGQWSVNADRQANEHSGPVPQHWWLRSPGGEIDWEVSNNVAFVEASGQVGHLRGSAQPPGLRPALWIYGDIMNDDGLSVFYNYTPFDFNTPITEDTHLIAMWDAVHDVTFDLNGADTPASIPTQTVPDGETATEPTPPPTRDGYTFRGWYYAPDGQLIITEHVHRGGDGTWTPSGGDTRYNRPSAPHLPDVPGYTRFTQSHLHTTMIAWGETNLAPELRARVLAPDGVDNDVRSRGEGGLWSSASNVGGFENQAIGRTTPGAPTPGSAANASLFVLSISEVHEYFDGGGTIENADRMAGRASSYPAFHGAEWWTRSPDSTGVGVATVGVDGRIIANRVAANEGPGFRAALWVDGAAPVGTRFTDTNDIQWRVLGGELEPFDFNTPITRDTNLIAMWDADGYEFQITFHMYDGSDDYEIVEVIPGTALNLTTLADRGIPVAHILGTPEAQGWALWGWFSDAQLDPATTGRPLRNGFRRPVVGATGFPIGSVITQTMIDDLFDANGNLDLFVIWSLWGDANDDDRVDAADVLQMQRHLHDLLMDLIGQPRTWDVTINQIAANVTVSGTVGAADILRIERHLHDLLMDMIGQPRIWDIVLGRP
ncbi:MAG: InlB B-repeat-containing protein [Oscillospiraceae bacterium]|nr:InlB B-repeat-containing protein [Oscillospiraceae bacterium]